MFSGIHLVDSGEAQAHVIFLDSSLKLPKGLGRIGSHPQLKTALSDGQFTGADSSLKEVIVNNVRVICVGVDPKRGDCWLRSAAAAGRRIALHGITVARLHAIKPNWSDIGTAFGLLAWNHTELKGSGTSAKQLPDLTLIGTDAEQVQRGLKIAVSVNIARNLSQLPPAVATPSFIADFCQKMAKEVGLKCDVIDGKGLEKERLQGLITVGQASENPPCLIRLEYKPKGATGKPIVFVGKTITYDTGGLSLKDRTGMPGMKRDKDGGCAVIGAMHALATVIQPERPVVALLVAAENSVSGNAYRPDDIITFRNGVTAEITNTDAEGRLVLADGLCWACEQEEPAVIIDIATLTGGVVTALGKVFAGLFCQEGGSSGLENKIVRVANRTGERVWPLPLDAEYRDMMKSSVADIVNSNPNRQAHPVQGATFLSYFVSEGTPWAHLDIAGTHATDKDKGPFIAGPTGFGVRLLAEFAEGF